MSIAAKALGWVDFVFASVVAVVAQELTREGATPDELVICWCFIGGFGGSIGSLHFYPVKDRWTGAFQFLINFICAGFFAPLLCDQVSYWLNIQTTIKLALPVSFTVGFFACQAIARGIPYLQQYFDKKAKELVREPRKRRSRQDVSTVKPDIDPTQPR